MILEMILERNWKKMTEDDYKFLISGLIKYITENTDFWDYHEQVEDIFSLTVVWANDIKSGLEETPFPFKESKKDEKLKIGEGVIKDYLTFKNNNL